MHRSKPIALFALAALGCAKDLKPTDNPDAGGGPGLMHITTTDLGGGASESKIEASSETEWRYYDFESKKEVTPANPDDSPDWDIAFQRFRVKVNGGVSGTGQVEVAFVQHDRFAELTEAPLGPYVTDQADSSDADDIPDYAFNVPNGVSELGWYKYDEMTHLLAPAPVMFVVRSVERSEYKLQFTGYYSEAGSSGYPKVRWGKVDPPSNTGTVQVDVSGSGFVHLKLASKSVVTVADPLTSLDWDVAVDEAAWQSNSGPARAGSGGAMLAPPGVSYEALTEAPTIGYTTDERIPFPAAPGAGMFLGNPVLTDWFNYDMAAHTATSKGLVHIVRTAAGEYAKLQILTYDNPTRVYTVRTDPLTRTVRVATATLTSTRDAWTYFDLRRGRQVAVTDPLGSSDWDLAFSRTRLRTNGGTSGPGMGGATVAAATSLDAISTAPRVGYLVDAEINDPENPGATTSANPALAGWYQVTTSTTPKDVAFVVRTARGDYTKLKIKTWTNGRFEFDWAYSGPGRDDF